MSPSNDDRTDSPRSPHPDDKAHIREHLDLSAVEWSGRGFQWAFVHHTDGETYVVLRRSSDADAAVLVYTMAEWEAFGAGARAGEFRMPSLLGSRGQLLAGLIVVAGLAAWLRRRRTRFAR